MKIVEKIRGRQTLRMLPFRVLVPRPFRVEGNILRMRSTGDARRAFTLIEMLAALALAMILLYMLFQIFTTVGRAMTISNARSEIHANARAILRIIHQEISGAFLDTSQDADADDDADYFIITNDTSSWGAAADYLQFLTSSALRRSGALSEVGYWLDTSDAKNPILRRRLASDPTNYDSDPDTTYTSFDASNRVLDMNNDGDFDDVVSGVDELPTTDAAKLATILGENVLAFNVEYYDAARLTDTVDNDGDGLTDSDDPDEAWVDDNYIAREKRLTPAVRITLKVRDRRGRLSEGEEFVEIIHIKGRE